MGDPADGPGAAGGTVEVRFVVEPNYDGWRLDRYLCEKIHRLSRTQVQRIIERDLDGARLKPSSQVRPGQVLVIRRPARPEPKAPEGLGVLYEDDDVVAVDKPAGLAMHPSALYLEQTLVARLRAIRPDARPDPAHRLDRETSGIVVCGKRPAVTGALKAAFAKGRVRKTYLAIVEGHPPDAFDVDMPLKVGGTLVRVKVVPDLEQGKPALTLVRTLERRRSSAGEAFALVRAEPKTGRQHQIRAHLAAAGYPVVGDKIYGPDEAIFVRFAERRMTDEDVRRLRLPRHALHAAELALDHPATKRRLEIRSPMPADLAGFLDGLEPHVDRADGR